jgi:hypothetical protein
VLVQASDDLELLILWFLCVKFSWKQRLIRFECDSIVHEQSRVSAEPAPDHFVELDQIDNTLAGFAVNIVSSS